MNCEIAARLIQQWQVEGILTADSANEFRGHLQACQSCRARYGSLLPLLLRDSGLLRTPLFEDIRPPEKLVDGVMGRLPKKTQRFAPVPSRGTRAGIRRRIPAYAAAAGFIFVLGFLLFFQLTGRLGDTVVVRLELSAPDAGSISLVGDFNDWEPNRLMLKDPDQDGVWEIRLRLPKGDSYTYNFIIDEETWVTDPNALIHVKDGFGGESSILSL